MSASFFLFAANAGVLTGLCLYLIFLGRQQSQLKQRLTQLEILDHDQSQVPE